MKIKILFLLTALISMQLSANILLEKPKPLSQEYLEKQASEWHTNFTWHQKKIAYSFAYENCKAGFAIKFLSIPFYWKNYRMLPTLEEFKFMTTGPRYHYETPLKFENQNPTQLGKQELIELIKNKKCIFYTGAGISMQGNVAGMAELMQNLKLENGTQEFLKAAWKCPKELCTAFENFCKSAIHTPPTPAHFALKKLAEEKSAAIITENVDLLQQRTGIEPIFAYSNALALLPAENWQELEAIICIGLSYDDRGLLARYKKHNPHGILVAVDLKTPTYISDKDYVCLGDLQEILT
jgi:Sir2 family